MPTPTRPTLTMQAVKVHIDGLAELRPQQRQDINSAINTFAKVCGRAAADIIADPASVRGLEARAAWQCAGLSKSRWRNVMSLLRKAMHLSGVNVHRQRRNFKLSPAWEAVLCKFGKRDRDELHRFAGWCSVHHVVPKAVTTGTFDKFFTYLEEQMTQRNPRERAHVARRAWNRTLAAKPHSTFPVIPAPESAHKNALSWEDFPASLQSEIQAYRKYALAPSTFDKDRKSIKPITLENYLTRLRVYLTTLVDSGLSPGHFASLSSIVDPETVKRGLESRRGTRELNDQVRMDLHSIAIALLSIATFTKVDDTQRAELRRFARCVNYRPHGLNAKNKERLAPLKDEKTLRRLISLPCEIAKELGDLTSPTVRQAQRMQMGCLLDILLHVPLRIRNVAELDLEENIFTPAGGQPGSWRISISGEKVKNNIAIDAQLSEDVSARIDRYVKVFRPVLMKQATSVLFLSQSGKPKGAAALSKQFARFIHREMGLTVHAHLMRHFAAQVFLSQGGSYEDLRRILAHAHLTTTTNSYAGNETDSAFAHLDALLVKIVNSTPADSKFPKIAEKDLL